MGTLVNQVDLDHNNLNQFRRDGFIKLNGLFTEKTISLLKKAVEARVEPDTGSYGNQMARLTFSLGDDPLIKDIYSQAEFKNTIGDLIEDRLIATAAQAFELTKGKSGLPWHYGYISFGYIRSADMGYSVWAPLNEIAAQTNGGGMAYVPEHIISAQHSYELGGILANKINSGIPVAGTLKALRQTHKLIEPILEQHKVHDNFSVGDALLFNKNIWHRSSSLNSGAMERRLGIVMRFVNWKSRIDRERWKAEYRLGGGIAMGVDTSGGPAQVSPVLPFQDLNDGAELRTSAYCGDII